MIKYDASLSMKLKNNAKTTLVNGTEILIKPIPDEPKPGRFDPREFEQVKARADAFTKMSSVGRGAPTILDMREMMGYPNLNMNTVEIYTKYEEHNFDGNRVGIWIHWPRKPEGRKGRSGFIYIHGGGWVGGTPYTVENPCRLLAERADCVVFNIDYSLAPEKPFPNGFNDCFNALRHIYRNAEAYGVDKDKLAMGGDSAGGNLTAACAIRDRDEGSHMLKYQVLIYPAVILADTNSLGYQWNINEFEMDAEQSMYIEPGLSLGRPNPAAEGGRMSSIHSMYLQHGEELSNPAISPMLALTKAGLCKALVAVAEFDGLRIQGEHYGKLLREAGVETRIIRYKGVGHAFLDKLGVLPQAEDLVQEIADDIVKL